MNNERLAPQIIWKICAKNILTSAVPGAHLTTQARDAEVEIFNLFIPPVLFA